MRIVQEAMALIGKIEEYDEKESWIEYTERLDSISQWTKLQTAPRNEQFCSVYVERRRTNSSGIWLVQGSLPTSRLQSW